MQFDGRHSAVGDAGMRGAPEAKEHVEVRTRALGKAAWADLPMSTPNQWWTSAASATVGAMN